MKGVEEVYLDKKLIAIVFRKNIKVGNVKFLTPENNNFQIGIHSRPKSLKLPPHIHKIDKNIKIDSVQEMLYLVSGKIRVNLYSRTGGVFSKKILTPGDSILLISEGHGVDFLEDSRIFEVKQGPYMGALNAKIYFK